MYLSNYLKQLSNNSELVASISETSEEVYAIIDSKFTYRSTITGLLIGNIQSGKTGQMFGLLSKMADEELEIFIILTTDSTLLAKQTFNRAFNNLTDFDVFHEFDDIKFLSVSLKKPVLIILKKNTSTLKRWRNLIVTSDFCKDRPIVILDDEADAASLNTMVNRNKTSTINQRLRDIKDVAPSSIYIEVTATPQAILLQTEKSQWKPSFIHYFKPGSNYIGGEFIYSEPTSFCIRFTEEDELDNIKTNSDFLPLGLWESLMTFIVICAEFKIKKKTNCNFLVHPSVRQSDHEKFATTLGENLNTFWEELNDGDTRNSFLKEVYSKWADLQLSYPDIAHYEDIYKSIEELLENESINIITINANSSKAVSYENGYNIVVGGNSLGRGVTLPKLQVVYYCRKSKLQQADTFWQHSRIFGYDREKGLIRVFLPPSLHKLFTDLNQSNKILIQQIVANDTEGLQLIYPDDIKPTRKQVLDNKALNIIAGGINFFALNPSESDPTEIDNLLLSYDEKKESYEVSGEFFINLLEKVEKSNIDWNGIKYANCAKALLQRRPTQKFVIAVRRNRDISKGTRTLLSETDNKLSKSLIDYTVLILYRLSGKKSKGWNDNPFWVPNIKFPDKMNFYDVIDL